MGSYCREQILARFMRSPEGSAVLDTIRTNLEKKTITDVDFEIGGDGIAIEIQVDGGYGPWRFFLPDLSVDAIEDDYADVLQREYLIDYPERADEFSRESKN